MLQGVELPKSLLTDKDSIHLLEPLGPPTNYFLPHMLVAVFHIGRRFRCLATSFERVDRALEVVAFVVAVWSIGEVW